MKTSELNLFQFKEKAKGNYNIVDDLKIADFSVPINHSWESSYILYLKDGIYLAPTYHIEGHGSFIETERIKKVLNSGIIEEEIAMQQKNLLKLQDLISIFKSVE